MLQYMQHVHIRPYEIRLNTSPKINAWCQPCLLVLIFNQYCRCWYSFFPLLMSLKLIDYIALVQHTKILYASFSLRLQVLQNTFFPSNRRGRTILAPPSPDYWNCHCNSCCLHVNRLSRNCVDIQCKPIHTTVIQMILTL